MARWAGAVLFSSAIFLNMEGMGVKYPTTFFDANGEPLRGAKNYRLNLAAYIPAKLFWSMTVYNPETGAGLDNGQPFTSLNQMGKPMANEDGSTDICFGPVMPGKGKNWTDSRRAITSMAVRPAASTDRSRPIPPANRHG